MYNLDIGMEENYIEIDSVLVDRKIFETSYTCDVKGYNCGSTCCYRGCIIRPSEVRRIEKHFQAFFLISALKQRGNSKGMVLLSPSVQFSALTDVTYIRRKQRR